MSKPAGKGIALSSFFKSKGKKTSAGADDGGASGGLGSGGLSGLELGLDSLSVPGLFDSSTTGWDDAPVALALDEHRQPHGHGGASPVVEAAVRDQLKVQLRELDDNDTAEDEAAMRKRIESEEARKAIEAAKRHAARAARKTAVAAAEEAAAAGGGVATSSSSALSTGGWAARLAARKAGIVDKDGWSAPSAAAVAGVKDGKVLTKDVIAFPTLAGAMA